MRKAPVSILALILGLIILQSVHYVLAQPTYPSDFSVWAISGGPAPWEELERIEINSTGYSTYWLMTNRTAADWVLNSTFVLSEHNLTTIWNSIQTNEFFSLAPNYIDPQRADGSYCIMNVTANAQTHSVMTQNIKVPQFDAIATTINDATPGTLDLLYNALIAEWGSPVDPSAGQTLQDKTSSEKTITLPSWVAFLYGPLICGTLFLSLQGIRKRIRKPHQRRLSRFFVLFLLFFLVTMLFANTVEGETIVTSGKCNVTVTINLEFHGSGVTQAFVDECKQGIENMWNGKTWCTLCTVTFVVNAIISQSGGTQPAFHQIQVVHWHPPMVTPRWEADLVQFNPDGKTDAGVGIWSDWVDPQCPRGYIAAHEVGHLMTRDDTYRELPGGGSVPIDEAHKNDIMAVVWGSLTPHQEHINGIIRDSGQIPPPFADAIPKTVTIVIPEHGRNTGAFNIKISNPGDNAISVSMGFAWTGPTPADTIVGVLTGFVDVGPHSTTTVGFPTFSVGPNAEPGIYPCRIRWTVAETGFSFDTDPYVELVKPTGGFVVHVDKFGLLAPYVGLASTILVAAVAVAIYIKRFKRREE